MALFFIRYPTNYFWAYSQHGSILYSTIFRKLCTLEGFSRSFRYPIAIPCTRKGGGGVLGIVIGTIYKQTNNFFINKRICAGGAHSDVTLAPALTTRSRKLWSRNV
ncbi:unnamed protein product [Ixodes pacificus]